MKQREIKFRAWWKKGNEMFHSVEINVFEDGSLGIAAGNGNNLFGCDEDFMLMQYTGIKDMYGKEIYEGDILECKEEKRGAIQLGERGYVYWNNAGFVVVDIPPFDWDVMSPFFQLDACKMEVIGNIHENAGLLAVAP